MIIVADTHVHIYPNYNYRIFFDNVFKNLNNLIREIRSKDGVGSEQSVKLICLTERYDCDFYSKELHELGEKTSGQFKLRHSVDDCLGVIENNEGEQLLIARGFQVVTKDKLEVLALCSSKRIEDGLDTRVVIERICETGGLPVLSWSPGKWMFAREKIVRSLVANREVHFLLGDILMRPGSMGSKIFKLAKSEGRKILAGTDPLPIVNEQVVAGRFASVFSAADSTEINSGMLRAALMEAESCGLRNSYLMALCRWFGPKISNEV